MFVSITFYFVLPHAVITFCEPQKSELETNVQQDVPEISIYLLETIGTLKIAKKKSQAVINGQAHVG